MGPPRWPDAETHPCPRCGSAVRTTTDLRTEHLKMVGWGAYRVASYVNWCGHGQEVIPFPRPDGSLQLVPVLGEAT